MTEILTQCVIRLWDRRRFITELSTVKALIMSVSNTHLDLVLSVNMWIWFTKRASLCFRICCVSLWWPVLCVKGSILRIRDSNWLSKILKKTRQVMREELDSLCLGLKRRTVAKIKTRLDCTSHPSAPGLNLHTAFTEIIPVMSDHSWSQTPCKINLCS